MRRSSLAAFLSFLWPGLGQAYQHRRRAAVVQALPQLVVVGGFVLALVILRPVMVVVHLLNPLISLSLLTLVVLLGLWHLWSISDVIGWPRLRTRRPAMGTTALSETRLAAPTKLVAIALAVLLVAVHAWVSYNLLTFYRISNLISQPPPVTVIPTPAPGQTLPPGVSPSPPGPTPTPGPPLPGQGSRVTILFMGLDNTHGDQSALLDTVLVASFDPRTGSLAMISIPRDTSHLPFYRGGVFEPRINQLRQHAANDPASYPDGPNGTVVNEVSYLIGIPVNYYAVIGISGLGEMIDAVGGVDINVPRAVNDPGYQFSATEIGFYVPAGWHHFDGKYGVAYARSRHGSSDYARAARQQQLLLALRDKLGDPAILLNLPTILDAVSHTVTTDAPLDRLPELVSIALQSGYADTRNIVLDPPRYAHGYRNPDGLPTNMNELNMDAVAQLSIELFGSDSRYAQ